MDVRRFSLVSWVIGCLLGGPAVFGEAQRPADYVVLISVDGLRPEFYRDPTWPAPTLQYFAREGAHAEAVRGVFPSVTYPSHTTLLTGALPARHGIYYNTPFEPGGETGRWYWEASAIRVPTLWDAARAAGLGTASIGWPVSVGAPVDRLIPEVWPLDDSDPVAAIRAAANPPGLWEEIEREATGRLREENFTIDHFTRDDRAGDIASYLFETYRPNLMTLHLIEADHFQHEDGRESVRVRRAVAAADRAIGQLYETVERLGLLDRTAFVVTGDHGFIDLYIAFAPNVWLVEAGLMEAEPDRGDWRATFHTSSASAFLHLRDPDDAEALAAVRAVLAAQPPGVRKLFRIVERDELDRLGAAPEAALALAPAPGAYPLSAYSGPAIRPRKGATHGFLPDEPQIFTGLVAYGAGIRPGAVAPRLGMEDVAPLVAWLLGLDFEAPDGILPAGLVQSGPNNPPH